MKLDFQRPFAAPEGASEVPLDRHGAIDMTQATGSEPFAFVTNGDGSLTRLVRMPDQRWILLSFNETEHRHKS